MMCFLLEYEGILLRLFLCLTLVYSIIKIVLQLKFQEIKERLWKVFNSHNFRGYPTNTVLTGPVITTSGHPLYIVDLASDYTQVIYEVDKNLDNTDYVKDIYDAAPQTSRPTKNRLSWTLRAMDLGLYDTKLDTFFVCRYGPI